MEWIIGNFNDKQLIMYQYYLIVDRDGKVLNWEIVLKENS